MSGNASNARTQISCPASSDSTTGRSPATPTTVKLRISLASGDTVALDVPRQLGDWDKLKADPGFQARVRGLLLLHDGHSYALCAPRAFRRVVYNVELMPGRDPGQSDNIAP